MWIRQIFACDGGVFRKRVKCVAESEKQVYSHKFKFKKQKLIPNDLIIALETAIIMCMVNIGASCQFKWNHNALY